MECNFSILGQNEVMWAYENAVYGVATTGRLLDIIGLFCKRVLLKRIYSAKETCNFKEPNNRS